MTNSANTSHAAAQAHFTTKKLVVTAMYAALILLATSILKIQTPTFGYIHIGDCFVLLAGIFLGPVSGGLAAGIGSGLSDLLGGYALWVPGTFVIKFLTALTAALLYRVLTARLLSGKQKIPAVVLAGITGEAVMVFGYFLYNILMVSLTEGALNAAGFASAAAVSLAEIPFNIVQGSVGILLATALSPVFHKITESLSLSEIR